MWIQFENKENAVKLILKKEDFEDFEELDLDDFKNFLRDHYPVLKDVVNEDIKLFDKSLQPLNPATNLNSLDLVGKTSKTIIIVRYPLSGLSSK